MQQVLAVAKVLAIVASLLSFGCSKPVAEEVPDAQTPPGAMKPGRAMTPVYVPGNPAANTETPPK